ncbi:ABC transporter ATP-binding protein [Victivallis sp. Marseille-Q1083]|uniref:ABC transporter ATP-binding protein n=1 Tax=Victivallis sp. Marseille-Q1083 TaxID=2717288 RepID=UPI001589D06D|nr:dipeptide ABC transporter ATP-binding protein [Victivallis sp. Marseille-Q1083]
MPLLAVNDLKVYYPVRTGLFGRPGMVRAVDGVSFELEAGETVGLVGESGCGKSTLGRALVRLETPNGGSIRIDDTDIATLHGRTLRHARKKFQMIFQDPYGSLNPRLTVYAALDEVLHLHTFLNSEERLKRIVELLELVGLESAHLYRYPHQFSGGQRQRIGIARALAAEPKLIVADEPVSALDVSVQAQIINLLQDIQRQTDTAFLFIAHDLGVVEHISRRILVMYLGKIVEAGPAAELCARPVHPYTQALLSAVPVLDAARRRQRIMLKGDVPSPLNPPGGCSFHPRCPKAQAICRRQVPPLRSYQSPERQCACFFPDCEQ